jgi:hypothetical protein
VFPVPIDQLTNFEGFLAVEILLRPVTEDFQLTIGDYSGICSDLSQANNSLAQCLDILTSQHVMFDRYVLLPFLPSFQPNRNLLARTT